MQYPFSLWPHNHHGEIYLISNLLIVHFLSDSPVYRSSTQKLTVNLHLSGTVVIATYIIIHT